MDMEMWFWLWQASKSFT